MKALDVVVMELEVVLTVVVDDVIGVGRVVVVRVEVEVVVDVVVGAAVVVVVVVD